MNHARVLETLGDIFGAVALFDADERHLPCLGRRAEEAGRLIAEDGAGDNHHDQGDQGHRGQRQEEYNRCYES